MPRESDRLFTPRFFLMCGFTFTVFLTAFQLFPTAPYRILELGGSTAASGLFLGLLTYASALSAPVTGALGDRLGHRRVLLLGSLALALFFLGYGLTSSVAALLVLAVGHGVVWSFLLTASSAYLIGLLPERRRAEGIAYWGLSTVAALAVAPAVGFAIYGRWGWRALTLGTLGASLLMASIALALDRGAGPERSRPRAERFGLRSLEWRVLVVSVTIFLYSFGYGGITSFSALYADATGVRPKSLYLTTVALVTLASRPFTGRLGDRVGYRRLLVPTLALIATGLGLLAAGGGLAVQLVSALVFGLGFGTAFPIYTAYVMERVGAERRGAAFGAMLSLFDIGIGTGSTSLGVLVAHHGYRAAFGAAAALSALALPYFLLADRWFRRESAEAGRGRPTEPGGIVTPSPGPVPSSRNAPKESLP